MMRKDWLLITHVVVLLSILVGALWAFTYFSGAALQQFCVIVVAVVAHIVWGAIYHSLSNRLTVGLLLEYILIGALVLLLFSWTLFS